LLDEAIQWAEDHRLGIGGGYRPAMGGGDDASRSWDFRFGLCATADGQWISLALAHDLWGLLSGRCERQGLVCVGGFRAYTAAESGERL
jgi:hypothetical protein